VDHLDLADFTGANAVMHGEVARIVAAVEGGRRDKVRGSRCIRAALGIGQVVGDRLLAQDGLARRDHRREMGIVGRRRGRHHHGVDRLVIERYLDIGAGLSSMRPAQRFGPADVLVDHVLELATGMSRDVARVDAADGSRAEQRDAGHAAAPTRCMPDSTQAPLRRLDSTQASMKVIPSTPSRAETKLLASGSAGRPALAASRTSAKSR
jgi:hypothetical protein